METWKPIPSCPNYEASSLGRIRRSAAGKRTRVGLILKPRLRGKPPYWCVCVTHGGIQKGKKVHRLVCEAFHGAPSPGMLAVHNDGNPANNTPENLRWATYRENAQDCFRHGTAIVGERAPAAKLTASDIVEIRAKYAAGMTQKQLAGEYCVHFSNINLIVRRLSWSHV